MKNKILFIVILLMLFPAIYLASIWGSLPATVPMHFNLQGEVDRYGNKNEVIVLTATLSLVALLVFLLLSNVHRITPKMASVENKERMQKIALSVLAFIVVVQCWLIYVIQNSELALSIKFILIAVCLLFAIIGNYMPNMKPNYVAGFRLPWTLKNEDNWRKTHHIAGRLWFGGGLLSAILFLLFPFKFAVISVLYCSLF
ncbi:MAG TPA: SdpI family protein [Chitinophagaceae bacterium]|nr:SdpI family protein [Chitinophagaceae bacterium]